MTRKSAAVRQRHPSRGIAVAVRRNGPGAQRSRRRGGEEEPERTDVARVDRGGARVQREVGLCSRGVQQPVCVCVWAPPLS